VALVTLDTLRTRIRQRTDQEHTPSEFVTDAELNQLINTSYAKLYGELVRAGLHVAESTSDVTATGAATYALPTDFYSMIGVYHSENGYNRRLKMHSARFRPGSAQVGPAISYRVNNYALELFPRPASGTYMVVYVPQPAELVGDDDTLDGVLGWEEFVVVDVSINVFIKEETDTSVLERERERLMTRIREEAYAAEMTESWVVENVRPSAAITPDMRPWRGSRGVY
jgi:hypothetical protein